METTLDQSKIAATENNELTEVPFDIIPLPSEGLLYPNGKKTIKVSYMTSKCENILTSPNLIRSGKVLDKLMEMCVKDPEIKVGDLLTGDRNQIMIFLRSTGYGSIYPVRIMDPETGIEFDTEVDLDLLKTKGIDGTPDDNMEFSFTLPLSKKKLKFKLLTSSEGEVILRKVEDMMKLTGNDGISPLLTTRLSTMVTQVDQQRDNIYIDGFIENMIAGDSLSLRLEIDRVEPGVNMEYTFTSPSGKKFQQTVPISADFFFPTQINTK
ncbi:hypothetical protein COB55_04385 [Candidatus Wolfebacteria bacterium]|nr:MAG: hypothetical protein COB55_04385 [Candidatus Wolfebacteria bacterium]